MTSDSTVSCLCFHHIVSINTNGGHEAERAEALSNNIGLHITVVVFASPYKATTALDNLSDDIIDQSVLIPEALSLHFVIELLAIESLESVNEKTIVFLEDSVLA